VKKLLTNTLLPAPMSQTPPPQVMNCVSIVSAGGVAPAGVVPVPVRGACCGLFGALSVTVSCAERVPASVGEKVIETLQLLPTGRVRPEQPSWTTVKSSVFGTAALLMNSDALPVFLTVTCCGALVVPVSCAANVSDDGDSETAGAEVVGGGDVPEGVQPASRAVADVEPSLTVTWHVDELYGVDWILKAPVESLLPMIPPGLTVTVAFGSAPLPSTRSCELFSSERVTETAAWALPALAPIATTEAATIASRRSRRRLRPAVAASIPVVRFIVIVAPPSPASPYRLTTL